MNSLCFIPMKLIVNAFNGLVLLITFCDSWPGGADQFISPSTVGVGIQRVIAGAHNQLPWRCRVHSDGPFLCPHFSGSAWVECNDWVSPRYQTPYFTLYNSWRLSLHCVTALSLFTVCKLDFLRVKQNWNRSHPPFMCMSISASLWAGWNACKYDILHLFSTLCMLAYWSDT